MAIVFSLLGRIAKQDLSSSAIFLALMIAFSFILPLFEEDITNFWDALWYCFAVITTIDFGDYVAKTIMVRVLTVY